MTKDPLLHGDAHKQAVAMARFWWNRYERMPKWRPRSRRKALREAKYWGEVAIKTKTTE